jgi:transposase
MMQRLGGIAMPRYKRIETGLKLLPVDLARQIVPGSFEHALCQLIDEGEVDLSGLQARIRNDACGAPAYHPGVLLKIVLLAYSRGILGSRQIEAACRDNVLFMAVSGDSAPHFTTLAGFICELGEEVKHIFTEVLLVCDRQGLIGRQMFAIDGVKLPSNASKAKSGTRKDFQRAARKMEKAVAQMLARHRDHDADATGSPGEEVARQRRIERLKQDAAQIRRWLKANPKERSGARGAVVQSNRTDNDSAKMATSKGVIQGYTGVATVDEKAQIILDAQAHGSGSEQALLGPAVDATGSLRKTDTVICADAGYHSEAGLKQLAEQGIEAYICDNDYRRRDPRFKDQGKHKTQAEPLYDKSARSERIRLYRPEDFKLAEDRSHCVCPAGKRLYSNGKHCTINGFAAMKFCGAQQDCVPCPRRTQCLRFPDKTKTRQVAFFQGRHEPSHSERMKARIDSAIGRQMIARRFATVEPVFGNLRHNKRLNRFTLRGRGKVDGQWKLYCLVHNIEKLAHHGYAQ